MSNDRRSLLFLCFDDLNQWTGFLGHPLAKTPNIDALARESAVFSQAYCTAPMCLPARTSVMWGEQPYQTGIYDHSAECRQTYYDYRHATPSVVTDFRAAGYRAIGCGKVFHHLGKRDWDDYLHVRGYADKRTSKPAAYYQPWWTSPWGGGLLAEGAGTQPWMLDFGPTGLTKEAEPDGLGAAWVRERLEELATTRGPRGRPRRGRSSPPFMVAFGTRMPHIPFRVPQDFFDLHPLESIPEPEVWPTDPRQLTKLGRRLTNTETAEKFIEAGLWRPAIQAYLAAGSFADWAIGTVLDQLAASPFADETAVMLWSDHGFHLGEKLHWAKFTLWEEANRVPLLLRVPDQPGLRGEVAEPVSTIDVSPTIADLCDVPLSPQHRGSSLLPVIERPALAADRPPISTWKRNNHAVRAGPWRFIRYRNGETELYDHRTDPLERENLAGRPDLSDTVDRLTALLPEPVPKPAHAESDGP